MDWDSFDKVLDKVSKRPLELKKASKDLRNNPTIVLAAVSKKGKALKYASDDMKNNKEVVM